MNDTKIRNRDNKVLATVRELSDGEQELRDTTWRRVGYYDPDSDTTFDDSGRRVGFGNVLMTLVDD